MLKKLLSTERKQFRFYLGSGQSLQAVRFFYAHRALLAFQIR